MEDFGDPLEGNEAGNGGQRQDGRHQHDESEWLETLVRSVAHLAAQLTMTQIRLRALASELAERGTVEPTAVAARVSALAGTETGRYLRADLGEALTEVIDVDLLEADVADYLREGDEG